MPGVREVTVDGFGNDLTNAIKGGNMIQFSITTRFM